MNEVAFTFAASHPVFAGHFPGRPIVPGALLLAEALQALVRMGVAPRLRSVSSAKFLSPVVPGERVVMRWQHAAGGALQVAMTVGERPVASMVVSPDAARSRERQ